MPTVDVVIPVYNEEKDLPVCISRLRTFVSQSLPQPPSLPPEIRNSPRWRIVVADNGSTDRTLEIARDLAKQHPDVAVIHLPEKGRGRALKKAWLESEADILSYMDVDLSTGLEAVPPLVDAIAREGYDLATGSRLMRASRIQRSFKRDTISRSYNLIVKAFFFTRFSDAQCGFKAISRRAARELLPLVKDTGWFFDTELLILAEKNGYRVKDIPVTWREDPDTHVKVVRTALRDLQGLLRLRLGGIPHPSSPKLE